MTQKQAKKELILHQCCVCWDIIPYPINEDYPLRCDTCESGYLCKGCLCKVKIECPVCRSPLPATREMKSDEEIDRLRELVEQKIIDHIIGSYEIYRLGKRGVNFWGGHVRYDDISSINIQSKSIKGVRTVTIETVNRIKRPNGQETTNGSIMLYSYNTGTRKFLQYSLDGSTIDHEIEY